MVDVAHWRTLQDARPKAISQLAALTAAYSESRVKKAHDLHCKRTLRERTDQLRAFVDLPPPLPPKSKRGHGAYHRVTGGRID